MSEAVNASARIQREAATPATSAVLSASAGSGKTKVLIDRFVRLCVEGERNDTHPRSILAVTFTRKAATEIQSRLLGRARLLALAADDDRRAELGKLFGRDPLAVEIDRGARLYERLLEDGNGLQVGTIHSFCQRILTRFAAEAGLDPRARLVEDTDELLDEALDQVEVLAASRPELAALALELSPNPLGLRRALGTVRHESTRLERWLRRVAERLERSAEPRAALLPHLLAEVRAYLFGENGFDPEGDPAVSVAGLRTSLDDLVRTGLAEASAAMGADADNLGKGPQKLAASAASALDRLANLPADDAGEALAIVRAVLFRVDGSVRSFTLVRNAELKGAYEEAVLAAAAPLLALLRRADLEQLYHRNVAQLTLGLELLDAYAHLKRRDGVVDFGDLEDFAVRLMSDEGRALGLLHRLDDSLRHILLDEAQDTNFNQIQILAPFIEEFLAGRNDGPPRTVFVVGDMKQSIYAFRGAEPGIFARLRGRFEHDGLPTPVLPTNFRSLPAVVDGVGGLFTAPILAARLPEGEAATVHQATAREDGSGLLMLPAPYEEDPDDGRSGDQVAADATARLVVRLVEDGPTTWSDVLVLVRTRTGVSLYEQALRRAGVPIEPAGRGMLAAGREVQDVLALLRWIVWPEDDVALATVLRSPLFRISEAMLQDLLAARGLLERRVDGGYRTPRNLWRALGEHEARPLAAAAEQLAGWRRRAAADCPSLLRRIYREAHVLDRYESALGPQARINLERLHDLALGSDLGTTPTVRRFIDIVDRAGRRGGHEEGTSATVGGAGRVRVMTIHGAKGLQAPVVLLVDANRTLTDRGTEVRLNPDDDATGLVFGVTRHYRDGVPGAPADLLQEGIARAGIAAATEETNLLYVAMTRAEDRLYVLGGPSGSRKRDPVADPVSPLELLRASASMAGTPAILDDPPELTRFPAPVVAKDSDSATAGAPSAERIWVPPSLAAAYRVEKPSAVDTEAAEAPTPGGGDGRAEAMEHGNRVHLLLQLGAEGGVLPDGDGAAWTEARAVFEDERLAWVFHSEKVGGRGLAEAPIIARRGGGEGPESRVTGIIDRLVVRTDRVDIIDYKTNRWGGDPTRRDALTTHYGPQLAAYRDVVAELFPGRPVRTWLLLTDPAGRGPDESGLVEVMP